MPKVKSLKQKREPLDKWYAGAWNKFADNSNDFLDKNEYPGANFKRAEHDYVEAEVENSDGETKKVRYDYGGGFFGCSTSKFDENFRDQNSDNED